MNSVMDLPVGDAILEKTVQYLRQIPLTLDNASELRELVKAIEKPLLETEKERYIKMVNRRLQGFDAASFQGQSENQPKNKEAAPQNTSEFQEQVSV